jgi:hypothetical protein
VTEVREGPVTEIRRRVRDERRRVRQERRRVTEVIRRVRAVSRGKAMGDRGKPYSTLAIKNVQKKEKQKVRRSRGIESER